MRNETKKVLDYVGMIPIFDINNLRIMGIRDSYLRVILSRLEKRGGVVRLKKGVYTSKRFIEEEKRRGRYSVFLEFLSTKLYFPSYLSLDYVLYENNLLTEMPQNFTLITKNKTAIFPTLLGVFTYHRIKDPLFMGFEIQKRNDFLIYKANRAKALLDFLYLRKRTILNKEMLYELRLNLDSLHSKDIRRLKKYVEIEGSRKMFEILHELFEE